MKTTFCHLYQIYNKQLGFIHSEQKIHTTGSFNILFGRENKWINWIMSFKNMNNKNYLKSWGKC